MTDVYLAAPTAPEELKLMFLDACARPTSIHQHLTVMRDTASGKKHITELGVGEGWSTMAWLLVQPDKLVLVDHGWQEILPKLQAVRGRTKIVFIESDDLMIRIEPTDLLFIDTEHHYAHLKEELRLFASMVREHIVLHDTTTFADVGEAPHLAGLWPAIDEFVTEHPEWRVANRFTHNNGLTILHRAARRPATLSKTLDEADYALLSDEIERVIEARKVFAGLYRFDHPHRMWEYAICLAALGDRKSVRGKRVLDVGGGSSLLTGLLAREGADVTVFDVGDHSAQAAALAERAGAGSIRFLLVDVAHDRTPEASFGLFDAVVCVSTVEHTDEHEKFFASLLRLVAPGGVLALTTDFHPSGVARIGGHNRTYNAEILNRWAAANPGYECEGGTDYADRGGPVLGYNFASLVLRRSERSCNENGGVEHGVQGEPATNHFSTS